MPKIIFVGGIENSGKSAFAAELEKSGIYRHINPDRLFEYLAKNPGEFFSQLKERDPEFYKLVEKICSDAFIIDYKSMARYLQDYLASQNSEKVYLTKIDEIVSLMVLDELKNIKDDTIPIYDALLATKNDRKNTYSKFSSNLKKSSKPIIGPIINRIKRPIDFNEAEKIFIYFNPGLDICIERLEHTHKTKPYVEEENIRDSYSQQEIPQNGELPNTNILVIDKVYPINKLVDIVQKEIQNKLKN